MARRRRPELGHLPRAQFGTPTPTSKPAAPPKTLAPPQLDPFPLLDRLIADRQAHLERVDTWRDECVAAINKEATEMIALYESEFRELQSLKRVFEGANLMGHDKESMYHLLAEQIGFLSDGSDPASDREQSQDRSS